MGPFVTDAKREPEGRDTERHSEGRGSASFLSSSLSSEQVRHRRSKGVSLKGGVTAVEDHSERDKESKEKLGPDRSTTNAPTGYRCTPHVVKSQLPRGDTRERKWKPIDKRERPGTKPLSSGLQTPARFRQ